MKFSLPNLKSLKPTTGSADSGKQAATLASSIFTASNLAIPALCILITVGLIAFVVSPQIGEYNKARQSLADTQQKINVLQQKVATLNQVSVQEYRTRLSTVLRALPDEADYLVSVSQLQSIAVDTKVQIGGVNFSEAGADGYTIKVDVEGTVEAIRQFIERINSAPRIMKVSNIDIVFIRTADTTNLYQASLTINSKLVGIPQQLGKADQPVPMLTSEDEQLISEISQLFRSIPSVSLTQPNTTENKGKANPFQ